MKTEKEIKDKIEELKKEIVGFEERGYRGIASALRQKSYGLMWVLDEKKEKFIE